MTPFIKFRTFAVVAVLSIALLGFLRQVGYDLIIRGEGNDPGITFGGATNDGVFTWDDSEDYFTSDDIRLNNTQWDDLRTPVDALKVPTLNPPEWVDYVGGQVLAFEDQAVLGNEEIVFFVIQLPHTWKEGTDVYPHVHWVPDTDEAANTVRWQMTYSWANDGADFGAATSINVDAATNNDADQHKRASFPALSGANKTFSSMIICSLKRNSSAASDTFEGDAYLLEIDFHFERWRSGTDAENSD